MSEAASLEASRLGLSQSPLWSDLLARVETGISSGPLRPGPGPSSVDAATAAVSRAHSSFVVALEGGSEIAAEAVSQLVAQATELVLTVARVWGTFGARADDPRVSLVDQLRRRLAAREDAVLAGEVTYSVWSEQAEEPSGAMRQALAGLSRNSTASQGDLISLSSAGVELAALLVRLAANTAASGRGGEAPQEHSTVLDTKLAAVTVELAARADTVERPVSRRGDVVVHHLAAALRVRVSQEVLQRFSFGSRDEARDPADLEGLRDAWLDLATNEYVAVAALDGQLETPCYSESFGSLEAALVESAANVICGGRLSRRPAAFRHDRAWRHQSVALTYALEAYVAGVRGHAPSLAQAQLIALTRLVRATVAITLIDLAGAQALSGNASNVL